VKIYTAHYRTTSVGGKKKSFQLFLNRRQDQRITNTNNSNTANDTTTHNFQPVSLQQLPWLPSKDN